MKRRTLAATFIALVGLALAGALGIQFYVTTDAYQTQLIREAFDGLHRQSDTIKRGLWYAMLHDDRPAITNQVQTFGAQQDIDGIRIFNKDGKVMFSTWDEEIGRSVDTSADACKGCHSSGRPLASLDASERTNIYEGDDGVRRFQIIEPIYNERACSTAECHAHSVDLKVLGVMESAISLQRIDREIARQRTSALLATLVILAMVSGLIYLLLRRYVAAPIRSLVKGTRIVAQGDLAHRIRIRQKDEIGELAESFNKMTQTIEETRGQLLQSERLSSLGRLSAGIAHEINNPLTGLLLTATTMRGSITEDSPERENLELVIRETERCRDIVRGLLDFARQTPTTKALGRIEDVVERSVQIVQSQAEVAHIPIRMPDTRDLPPLMMDDKQMQQVFVNLLVNALDAMPDGGSILVEWRDLGGREVEVDVVDTGVGIPKEHLASLFEPFFSTKGSKGTGLGLAICWGIVEQHGGRIDVRSAVGRGTTFTVRLPVRNG